MYTECLLDKPPLCEFITFKILPMRFCVKVKHFFRIFFFAIYLLISACGSSSGEAVNVNSTDKATDIGDPTSPNENQTDNSNQLPRIETIINFIVTEGSVFQLVASANDPDGQISTYQWQQLKGPTIELFETKTNTLTLRAPEVSFDTPLLFELTVSDNQGATTSEQFTLTVVQTSNRALITGTVSFDRLLHNITTNAWDTSHVQQRPSREILVELVAGDSVINSTFTDIYGTYKFPLPSYVNYPTVRVRASATLRSDIKWLVDVRKNTDYNNDTKQYPLYSIESDIIDLEKATLLTEEDIVSEAAFRAWLSMLVIDINTDSTSRDAAPFAILDTTYTILQHLNNEWDPSAIFPDLTVYWSKNNTAEEGNFNEGKISAAHYKRSERAIVLKGDINNDADEYDEMLIGHEFGHFFQSVFSRDHSVGGIHTFSDHLNMSVAFSEGFATAFAGMALKQSVYRDGSLQGGFHVDLENNTIDTVGWYNETSVASLLYDLYDSTNENVDNTSLGIAPILNTMRNEIPSQSAKTSIFSFMTGLYQIEPEIEPELENLLLNQQISPYELDAYGSTETNNAGVASLLPIYKNITVNGNSVTVCSIDDFMTYEYNANKLGARQYLRFSVDEDTASEVHNIYVEGDFGRDPEVSIYYQGEQLNSARNPNGANELLILSLDRGEYVIEIGDFFNLTIPLGETCFTVSITTDD